MAVCLSTLGTSLNPLTSNQGALAQSNPSPKVLSGADIYQWHEASGISTAHFDQSSDHWGTCTHSAIDIPDASCHWYITAPDNTFGEGFDWASAPWFDANGLRDVPSIDKQTAIQKLQAK